MYRILFTDVVPGCTARFEHHDLDALIAEVARHAAQAHGLDDVRPALLRAVVQTAAHAA